jgi:hypothetical protein
MDFLDDIWLLSVILAGILIVVGLTAAPAFDFSEATVDFLNPGIVRYEELINMIKKYILFWII